MIRVLKTCYMLTMLAIVLCATAASPAQSAPPENTTDGSEAWESAFPPPEDDGRAVSGRVFDDPLLSPAGIDFVEAACAEDDDDCEFNYGPDPCLPRTTLFQWSYGTSFSGGPDLDEPLVTDRPDFTEASSTVGLGVLQIEAGYTYVYDVQDDTTVREQSFGEPLFRYGVFADWLEFRLAVFPVEERVVSAGRRETAAGTEDLYLGFKIGLTPQEGVLPEMAVIPQTLVPTGSTAFTNDEVLPGVNWLYSWDITDRISTAGSSQINRVLDEVTGRSYLEYAQSWTVGAAITEELGGYIEWFALIPHSADTTQPQHVLNGGFTYLFSNDVQFDIRAGTGLNRHAPDYFLGTGLSVRFR